MKNNKIDHINYCIQEALSLNSKLNNKALNMRGMSSPKNRHFLNRLLEIPDARYLEIGTWLGSTLYSALYKNSPVHATAIDNFSQFDGTLEKFQENMSDVGCDYEFINQDCFSLNEKLDKKYNIYFYDGDHTALDQEKALTYYYDNLDDEFIYICDDWNHKPAQIGTEKAIKEMKFKVVEHWELEARYNGDTENWWNGLLVCVLNKN